jgi:hypothetical protein
MGIIARIRLGAVSLLLAGCLPTPVTAVVLRDPHEVSLEIETPSGKKTLLAARGPSVEVDLPRTVPPWDERLQLTASAIRDGAGGISVRCDACQAVPERQLVPPSGAIVLPGPAARMVTWQGDELSLRFAYPYDAHFSRRRVAADEAFTVRLVTPTRNVVEVHDKRIAHPREGWWLLGIAGVFVAAAALEFAAATIPGFTSHPDSKSSTAFGAGFLGCGLALGVDGVVTLAAPGSDTAVEPRR